MAKKISTFSMTHLLVPTHYEFHYSVAQLIRTATPAALMIEDLVPKYTEEVTRLFEVINRQRGSEVTPQLIDTDVLRDAHLSELFNTIDAARRSAIAARQTAGLALYRVASPYRGIGANEYNKETAQIRGLLRDLGADDMAAHIDTLTLGSVVQGLRQANNKFATLMEQRNVQEGTRAASVDISTTSQQRVVNNLYSQIIEKINAVALLQPTEAVNTFIDNLNGYVIEYKKVTANMRAGGTASEKGTGGRAAPGKSDAESGSMPEENPQED